MKDVIWEKKCLWEKILWAHRASEAGFLKMWAAPENPLKDRAFGLSAPSAHPTPEGNLLDLGTSRALLGQLRF